MPSQASTQISVPGLTGFIESPNTTNSGPESLRHIAAYLSSVGYSCDIKRGDLVSRQPGQVVRSTITGWLLTWSRENRGGLETFGRLWVAAGVGASKTPFTSMLAGGSPS